jgi:hypothetical protein
MQKALLCAAVLFCAATPASADPEFIGEMIFTAGDAGCTSDPTGDYNLVRFRPIVDNNGDQSELSLFGRDWSSGLVLRKRNFDKTLRYVQSSNTYTGFGPSDFGTLVQFVSQSPATILATTTAITVTGKIENYDNREGCTASFNMILVQRVWQ